MKTLKLGFPKGSLQESTLELFKKAGIKINATDRSYFPSCDDAELEIMMVRSQEMAKYVEDGVFDAGLTGFDWICESGARVTEVCELIYAKSGFRPVRWVLAVPNDSKIKSLKDLNGKRVATELQNYVRKYFAKNKVKATVEFSWGATEAKAGRFVDAIVELTETGSSLRANNLKIIATVLESTTKLIANKAGINGDRPPAKMTGRRMATSAIESSRRIPSVIAQEPESIRRFLARGRYWRMDMW